MKFLLALFASVFFSSTGHADCMQGAEVAKRFINDYKKYHDDASHKLTTITTIGWIQSNNNVTDSFKKSYKQLVDKANKEDPEMGLGFDPIFDAQDYPERGLTILNCNHSNFITLHGSDWESFELVVKTIHLQAGWLVDGAGVRNIPKIKRAHRD
ncbi:MAG: hypothetical protein ACOH1I_07620 [Gallionellaceae bacterium]